MPQSRASAVPPASVDAADSARTIALQMLEERGRGAVLVSVAPGPIRSHANTGIGPVQGPI